MGPLDGPARLSVSRDMGVAQGIGAKLGSAVALGGLVGALSACSSAPAAPPAHVAPAPPPKDEGRASQGGPGGATHSSALEQLKVAPMELRTDRQESIRVALPDSPHWTRVSFWGVKSLVGYRYGKGHHAVVGAVVTKVADNSEPGACAKSFNEWAKPYVGAFDVEIHHEAPQAAVWNGQIAEIEVLMAKTATLMARDSYAVAYGLYPAWPGACLVVGVAVPAREDEGRAREVRDRFVREILPRVQVIKPTEPKERY